MTLFLIDMSVSADPNISVPYPPSYGLNSTTSVLLGEWLWH